MKLLYPFFVVLCISAGTALSQNPCDSLSIQCCQWVDGDPDLLRIEASNHSPDIFSYPGFVLFDESEDTIAKEMVNYFGIGWDFQPHDMVLYEPWSLPFEGTLQLYTLFYDSLSCSWPINLPDTALHIQASGDPAVVRLFPNPAQEVIQLFLPCDPSAIWVTDLAGRKWDIQRPFTQESSILMVKYLSPGIYVCHWSCGDQTGALPFIKYD